MKQGNHTISRKRFLKTAAAAALGTVLKPSLKAFAQTSKSKPTESGQWKSTTCQGCTSWCSVQVYVVDGRAVKVRGGYSSMAAHALNGLVGSVDNVGGTLKGNKEYTLAFPLPDAFVDDIAKAGKAHKKIDHRGTKAFPVLSKGKPGGGVVTNNAADGFE
jgi:anaerobic selenocysteine-containing dehydrogenase